MEEFSVVEVCAGAGGQSLGLHQAGFSHAIAVELDSFAAETLRENLHVTVAVGDVADPKVWDPSAFRGVTLLAGGVPCPPFSLAGKQLGSSDERDLFAWTIEQVGIIQPRAVMLENVRGLSGPRFAAYRQRVIDRLAQMGYVGEWKLLTSADFGVPQLRPRFVLVAMRLEDQRHFYWPSPTVEQHVSVGETLRDLMASRGWKHADEWARLADGIGPTIVGGSKKHGGADLGPTRAKLKWAELFVDGKGVVDVAPDAEAPSARETMPRLTVEMVARIQGWKAEDDWKFAGRKTSQYRQVGNAFPPPVAKAIGEAIIAALRHEGPARTDVLAEVGLQDPAYRALAQSESGLTFAELAKQFDAENEAKVHRWLTALRNDFDLHEVEGSDGVVRYQLGEFQGFIGQEDHHRHDYIQRQRNRVS